MSPSSANSTVNDQASDAAESLLRLAAGGTDTLSAHALRQAAAQTGAMMLQDAADHLRRTQILAEAAMARALADLADGKDDGKGDGQAVIDAAQSAVSHAIQAQAEIGDVVAKLMANLPGGAETG